MNISPEWATWSLEGKDTTQRNGSEQLTIKKETSRDLGGGAALFTSTAKDDIYHLTWHEHETANEDRQKDKDDLVSTDVSRPKIEAVDLDEMFKVVEGESAVGVDTAELHLLGNGHYRFEPLTPVESRALQRALKLSKYIPPSAQEVEEEKQRMRSIKVIQTETKKNDPRRKGIRINEETGKRIYNVGKGASGLSTKENNHAKEILKTMCASMLPRRHFDWILVQLTYNKCNMLGFDDIPSLRSMRQDEARDSVAQATMPPYNLAHVTKLLADASKVDTSIYDVIDPTRGARARGIPAVKVRDRMLGQSNAIFEGLQKLFPALFSLPTCPDANTSDGRQASAPAVVGAHRSNEELVEDTSPPLTTQLGRERADDDEPKKEAGITTTPPPLASPKQPCKRRRTELSDQHGNVPSGAELFIKATDAGPKRSRRSTGEAVQLPLPSFWMKKTRS